MHIFEVTALGNYGRKLRRLSVANRCRNDCSDLRVNTIASPTVSLSSCPAPYSRRRAGARPRPPAGLNSPRKE
jgi:hypothetical protein